jgi:hypothetical protein
MKHFKFFNIIGWIILLTVGLSLQSAHAIDLTCPDSGDELHHKDVLATSAPEIKTRAANQGDSALWAKIVKPLTQKAIKLAKDQRAVGIEDGVEHACTSPQTYVAQIVNVPDTTSGCEHHVVTRPAEADHIYVQVIATCKYDWSCCSPKESKAMHSAGFTLEGPLNPAPPSAAAPAAKPSKHTQ